MFSDLGYSKSGDLSGIEVWIVPSEAEGMAVVFQDTAEVPGRPIIVAAKVDGSRVTFAIPEGSDGAGTYSGVVTDKDFRVHWERRARDGHVDKGVFVLKRKESYWQRH